MSKTTNIYLPVALVLGSLLTACGGDDAGPDKTPSAFSLAAITEAPRGEFVESQPVRVSGINTVIQATIVGGRISVNGGDFSAGPVDVNQGDVIVVRVKTQDDFSALSSATLTLNSVSATFEVTTEVIDETPDSFEFSAVDKQLPGTQVYSNSVTISGINTVVNASATLGGELSVNGGDFLNGQQEVVDGDTLVVRVSASDTLGERLISMVTVGTNGTPFEIRTRAEIDPPQVVLAANLQNNAVVYDDEIVLSGTISDASDIVSFTINGDASGFEIDESGHWSKSVFLSDGVLNTFDIVAQDAEDNAYTGSLSLNTTPEFLSGSCQALTDNVDAYAIDTFGQRTISWLPQESRIASLNHTGQTAKSILQIVSGYSDVQVSSLELNGVASGSAIITHPTAEANYVLSQSGDLLLVDFATGAQTLLSENNRDSVDLEISSNVQPNALDAINNVLYVFVWDEARLVSIDLNDGSRQDLGKLTLPAGDLGPSKLYVANGLLFIDPVTIGSSRSDKLLAYDPATGLLTEALDYYDVIVAAVGGVPSSDFLIDDAGENIFYFIAGDLYSVSLATKVATKIIDRDSYASEIGMATIRLSTEASQLVGDVIYHYSCELGQVLELSLSSGTVTYHSQAASHTGLGIAQSRKGVIDFSEADDTLYWADSISIYEKTNGYGKTLTTKVNIDSGDRVAGVVVQDTVSDIAVRESTGDIVTIANYKSWVYGNGVQSYQLPSYISSARSLDSNPSNNELFFYDLHDRTDLSKSSAPFVVDNLSQINPNATLPIEEITAAHYDAVNGRVIVFTKSDILAVDPSSGEASLLMSLTGTVLDGSDEPAVFEFAIGADGNSLLAIDNRYSSNLLVIDLVAGTIDNQSTVGEGYFFSDLAYNPDRDVYYATSVNETVVWVLDSRAASAVVLSQ